MKNTHFDLDNFGHVLFWEVNILEDNGRWGWHIAGWRPLPFAPLHVCASAYHDGDGDDDGDGEDDD